MEGELISRGHHPGYLLAARREGLTS
jgi:hypothetical protein